MRPPAGPQLPLGTQGWPLFGVQGRHCFIVAIMLSRYVLRPGQRGNPTQSDATHSEATMMATVNGREQECADLYRYSSACVSIYGSRSGSTDAVVGPCARMTIRTAPRGSDAATNRKCAQLR
jgi:hypothetical protein